MKKILSFVLVCAMMLGMLSVVSFADEAQKIEIAPKFGAWENWVNSPNKGSMASVTQLLVGITLNGEKVDIDAALTWKLTIAGGDQSKTVTMSPATKALDYNLYRFETCLGEGDNQFVPVKGVDYTVTVEVYDGDTLLYYSDPTSGFTCPMDPVVPGVEVPDTIEADLEVSPIFGKIENWGGKTYFITEVTASNNDVFYAKVSDRVWDLRVSITDDTTGYTYVIDPYAFDVPGSEIYSGWFFRFAPADYAVPLDTTHVYSVKVEVLAEGEVIASGASATGAFNTGNDAYLTDGPIVPEEVPHSSTVIAPPEPTTENIVLGVYGQGMENWSSQTQVLICPKFEDGSKVAALYSAKDAVWEITFKGVDGSEMTVKLAQSSQYDGGTWGILRFQPCVEEEGNRFIPLKDCSYTVEATVTVGTVTYVGTSAEYAFTMPAYPIVDGVENTDYVYELPTAEYPYEITLGEYHTGDNTAYKSDWEIWREKETLILMFRGDIWSTEDIAEGGKVVLTINGVAYEFVLESSPTYVFAADNVLVRIPTEGIFTPVEGTRYTVSAKYYNAEGTLLYTSNEIDTITYGEVLKAKNGFVEENGKLYYYVDDVKVKGWFEVDGVQYFASSVTNAVINYDKTIGGKQYFWTEGKGLVLADGFYADENGTKCYDNGYPMIGWRHTDGSSVQMIDGVSEQYSTNPQNLYYFLSTTGYMVTDETYVLGGYKRDFNADHTVKPLNGLQNRYGIVYYYIDGVLQLGWQEIDGDTYYFLQGEVKTYGQAATKWMYIGNKVYYFYAGSSATPYVLKTEGAIGGITYEYTEEGYILYNGFVNLAYANEVNNNSAANIQKKNATTRYMVDGEMQEGWQQIDGNWYYFYKGTGYMCVESRTIGGVWYDFTADGVCTSYEG